MDNLQIIRSALEKILKAILIKISNGDQISVSKELIWYDDLIAEIFHLRRTDFYKFTSIVDPLGRFKIVPSIDLAEIDWSRVTIEKKAVSPPKQDRRLYRLSAMQAEYDLIDTYISFSMKVWDEGISVENFDVAWRAIYTIGNLYSHIAFSIDATDRFNFAAYYNFLTQKLQYKIAWLVSKDKFMHHNRGMIEFLVITINVDHLIKEDFKRDRYELWSANLFLSLKLCIDNDQSYYIKELIRDIAGKNVDPLSDTSYTHLYRIIEELLDQNSTEDESLLRQVAPLGFYRPDFNFTPGQFFEYLEDLAQFKAEVLALTTDMQTLSEIQRIINGFERFAHRKYKARMLQRVLAALLAYLVFKHDYEPIDFTFSFSQPSDANASWSGSDLTFIDFIDILGIISAQHSIETEFMAYWPDRHGMTVYIDIFLVVALMRWIIRNYNSYHGWRQMVTVSIQAFIQNSKDGSEKFAAVTSGFEDLANRKDTLIESRQWPFERENVKVEEVLDEFLTFVQAELGRQKPANDGFSAN